MIIIDANIILRLFIGDNEEMANKSIELIDNNPVLVLPEVLEEVTFVMTKFYGRDRKDVSKAILELLDLPNVNTNSERVITRGAELYGETSLDFVDCLLCAYHTEAGYEIGTFDNKLLKLIQRESEPKETNSENSQTV